jgi:hypothetical protein
MHIVSFELEHTSYYTELVFTELILQVLFWICEIAIHSYVLILDLSPNINLWNQYYFFLAGNWVVSTGSLFEGF